MRVAFGSSCPVQHRCKKPTESLQLQLISCVFRLCWLLSHGAAACSVTPACCCCLLHHFAHSSGDSPQCPLLPVMTQKNNSFQLLYDPSRNREELKCTWSEVSAYSCDLLASSQRAVVVYSSHTLSISQLLSARIECAVHVLCPGSVLSLDLQFEKAQSAFEAALALARRDGIEKSELQEEISRLRAELAQLTKTMEQRLTMAESMQMQAIENETRCSASLKVSCSTDGSAAASALRISIRSLTLTLIIR